MKHEFISTTKAPAAIGPYSQAVKVEKLMFISGQIPFIPETMELVAEDIQEQTRQCLKNIRSILERVGAGLNEVVKVTVFITDMNDFGKVNEIYAQFFTSNKPARACVEVRRLPKDVKIQIEAVAYLN